MKIRGVGGDELSKRFPAAQLKSSLHQIDGRDMAAGIIFTCVAVHLDQYGFIWPLPRYLPYPHPAGPWALLLP